MFFKIKNKTRKDNQRRANITSGSSPVYSYYNNRPSNRSDKSLPRRINSKKAIDFRYHIRHIPSYIAFLFITGSVLYGFTLTVQPKILIAKELTDSGLIRSQYDYQQGIQKILEKSVLNRTKLTLDTVSVSRQIEDEFPEIQNATVSLPFFGRNPIIGLEPAIPRLIYNVGAHSFVIGSDGRALVSSAEVQKTTASTLPVLTDDGNIQIEQGSIVLPKEYVDFITTVILQLNNKNISVKSLHLPAVASELKFNILNKPYYIKFDMSGDARLQSGTFLAVSNRLISDGSSPSEYIDVRVPERAYYK